jgi:uncharacterized protein DUF4388
MRGLMGSFAVLPLPDLVELLGRRRASGSLTAERGTVRKTLHLREGSAVGAASNDPREYLGQLLINFGHIGEEQLAKAFQTHEETKVRLGKVLTMVGLVPPDTIREVVAIKIRETILDVFLWDSGLFYFDDTPPAAVDGLDAEVPLAEISREAEFRATAWQAFRAAFPGGAVTLLVDDARVPAAMGPETLDGRLLALAREGKTVDEIGLALHATDFHLVQRLYALHGQGILRTAPAGPPLPPPGRDAATVAELLDRARGLIAGGRAGDAEEVAARAVQLAPGIESARSLLAEAERLLSSRLRSDLLEPPRTPRLRIPTHEIALMRLGSADKYLLSRCDGRRTVGQLVQIAPLRELEVLKAIRRFADTEIVELG